MLRANQAVRLGLRAASRNPELAFGKALLDLTGNLFAALPILFTALMLFAALADDAPLAEALRLAGLAGSLRWPIIAAVLATLIAGWALGMVFWSGALPLLAADAEMDARPPPGNFWLLASRGLPRVLRAGALASSLSLLVSLASIAAFLSALPLFALHPSPTLFALLPLLISISAVGGILVDLLLRLVLVRSAALGDSATSAFARAASLLGARLGTFLLVALAFLVLELLVGAMAGMFTGVVTSGNLIDPSHQLIALGPRIAVAIASGVIFSWLEVGRQGALAAIAADAEGLLALPSDPVPPVSAPTVLERPRALQQPVVEAMPEAVIDALPVSEEVVEALPAEEPVVEALPADDEPEKK